MLKISKKTSLNEILKKFISFIQKILDFIMRGKKLLRHIMFIRYRIYYTGFIA